jgi:hypothetical protein
MKPQAVGSAGARARTARAVRVASSAVAVGDAGEEGLEVGDGGVVARAVDRRGREAQRGVPDAGGGPAADAGEGDGEGR